MWYPSEAHDSDTGCTVFCRSAVCLLNMVLFNHYNLIIIIKGEFTKYQVNSELNNMKLFTSSKHIPIPHSQVIVAGKLRLLPHYLWIGLRHDGLHRRGVKIPQSKSQNFLQNYIMVNNWTIVVFPCNSKQIIFTIFPWS